MRTQQPPAGEPLLPAALAGLAALFVSLVAGVAFSPVQEPFGLENVAARLRRSAHQPCHQRHPRTAGRKRRVAVRMSPSGDTDELVDAIARARGDANASSVAVHGLQRLYDAQWVALIPFDDTPDRAVVWAGDLPAPDEDRPTPVWNGRLGHRLPPGIGSAAHVFVAAEHPAVLVVMPRSGRPLTQGMHATMLGVARALEADVALPASGSG